jgi:hypothetical protein
MERIIFIWHGLLKFFLKGKGLFTYLISGMPKDTTPSLWEQEDNQIISLMLNNIESHIGSSCIYLPTAKDIWIISVICVLVLEISLRFIRCVNNILSLNKVLRLWMSTTI